MEIIAENYPPGFIKKVISTLGIRVSHETDTQLNMCCPFHSDRAPSFTVNTETGLFFCFNASCGSVGTLIELVMKYGNMLF